MRKISDLIDLKNFYSEILEDLKMDIHLHNIKLDDYVYTLRNKTDYTDDILKSYFEIDLVDVESRSFEEALLYFLQDFENDEFHYLKDSVIVRTKLKYVIDELLNFHDKKMLTINDAIGIAMVYEDTETVDKVLTLKTTEEIICAPVVREALEVLGLDYVEDLILKNALKA